MFIINENGRTSYGDSDYFTEETMKSIGIITYHHYCNYGTMLQAYALQHKITSMGYDAELIDFMQDNSMSKLELLELRMKRLPVYIMQRKKYAALAAARKKFLLRH